ncbi:hypothetical protein VTN00DRAFT_7720 [Thermoascus crustaceus]|uniref:uncharacterized protein n=1 Tax=Thermoascus crustaceus TaxID=5088 RepID=UPI003741F342
MPPRKQDDSVARMRRKRDLIDKYNIVFDGPIPSREWPVQYAPIFHKLREIEGVTYEEYLDKLACQPEKNPYPSPITERVAELTRVAYDMRNSLANEATRRSGTEHLVLKRFEVDVPCGYCQKRRWLSEFQIVPSCPLTAEKLRRIIDLWHGTVLRDDNALRIFLIVDMICDWARDIYRKQVLRCLASLNPVPRDFTPAESCISFDPLSDDDPLEYEDEGSLANSDSPTASTHSDISHSPIFVDEPVEHEDDEFWIGSDSDATPATDSNFATPDVECISLDSPTASDVDMADAGHHSESQIPETEHWSRHAVIRHANDVLFVFQLLSLPDSQDRLTAVLRSISFSRDPAQTARKLLALLEGTNHVSIYRSEIREVEAWWTETHNGQEPQSDDEMCFTKGRRDANSNCCDPYG